MSPHKVEKLQKITLTTQLLLEELLDSGELYGLQLIERTEMPSGTVYPLLSRLEGLGWVESRWEPIKQAHAGKRPPRRYYRLTEQGAKLAQETLLVRRRRTPRANSSVC